MKQLDEILPPDAYLATCYHDARNSLVTRRVFYNDGRVEAFDGQEWWTVCRFTPEKTRLAMEAIIRSGLTKANDLSAAGVYDTAILTYAWRLPENEGMVRNFVYPALDHPAFENLDVELETLYNGS